MEEFKDRFLEALSDAGLTQADIARKCNLVTSAVSNYATGRMVPKAERLHDIAVALDVNEMWLVAGIGDKKRGHFIHKEVQEMVNDFYILNKDEQKAFKYLIHILAEKHRQEV